MMSLSLSDIKDDQEYQRACSELRNLTVEHCRYYLFSKPDYTALVRMTELRRITERYAKSKQMKGQINSESDLIIRLQPLKSDAEYLLACHQLNNLMGYDPRRPKLTEVEQILRKELCRITKEYLTRNHMKNLLINSVNCVKEFHELFDHPVLHIKEAEPLNIRQLRIKLLFEELKELAEAGDVMGTFTDLCSDNSTPEMVLRNNDGDEVNRVDELDALCDLQYVLDGKKLTSGLHEVFDEAFRLVHENNMAKAHKSIAHIIETEAKGRETLVCHNLKGPLYVAKNKAGKVIKPHDHKKVDLSNLIPAKG